MSLRRTFSGGEAILLCIAAVLLGFIIAVIVSVAQNNDISVTRYEVSSPKIKSGFRAVLISDLHRKKFDKTNQKLVDLAAAQEPDLIFLDGDMLERKYTPDEADELISLIERLADIAPVYYAIGNHDDTVYSDSVVWTGSEIVGLEGRSALLDRIEAAGAVFLESEYRDIDVNGDGIRIGGFYPFAWRYRSDTDESWGKRQAFLEDFCDFEGFKLMLSHRPDSFIFGDAGSAWDIDLVLSGHTHNGVIATPISHRAIWTTEGFFPEHAYGEHDLGSVRLIVTSGLAGWRSVPRVFNPPEIAVIDVTPEE